MAKYRNDGAGWRRKDGTRIARGDVFEPTASELASRYYKLSPANRPARATRPSEAEASGSDETASAAYVDQYATGGGWYDIPGVGKVQGRAKAVEALGADDGLTEG